MLLRRVLMAGAFAGALFEAGAVAAQEAPPPPTADKAGFYELLGEDDPNPVTYEFAFVSVGINQTFGIANWTGGGFFFGAGGGVGTPLYAISSIGDRDPDIDPTLEAVFGNVFLRLTPFRYLDLDVGGRLAVGSTTHSIDDAPRGAFIRAGYADLRVGTSKIKFGPRFEYDNIVYDTFTEQGWKLTPIMLRVVAN